MGKGRKTRSSMFSFGLSSSDEDGACQPNAGKALAGALPLHRNRRSGEPGAHAPHNGLHRRAAC